MDRVTRMKNITMQIKVLNQVYREMKNNFGILKRMFNKQTNIAQKITLAEGVIGQVYMAIMEKITTEEVNRQFIDIIKEIKKEQDDSKRD